MTGRNLKAKMQLAFRPTAHCIRGLGKIINASLILIFKVAAAINDLKPWTQNSISRAIIPVEKSGICY
jgi:hypothetical protein